jgi:hypothetical protein
MGGRGTRPKGPQRDPYVKKVGYRPRRSGAVPTVAQPEGPLSFELKKVEALHPEAMDYIREAVKIVYLHRCDAQSRPEVWLVLKKAGRVLRRVEPISAEQIVAGFVDHVLKGTWADWKLMLNVVRDIALADPRYYGITDPMTQQYCSLCRKVKKLNEFPNGKVRCYQCTTEEDEG